MTHSLTHTHTHTHTHQNKKQERARNLTAVHAGLVMFSGQFFDALATPAAGFLSDVTPGFPKQGCDGRMLWYIIGTVLAMVSFMGVFAFSPFASSMDSGWCVVYFAVCASLFNVGWAAVQVCVCMYVYV